MSMVHKVFITILSLLLSLSSYSQSWTGNLGRNIFTDGDFGSGTTQEVQSDPGIAPGYEYTTNTPPNDGQYTLTNNTSNWGWFAAEAWVNIRDNSPDPNGYMMVVNASYSPGVFFEQEVDGLCENTWYVFSMDIINLVKKGENAILPNVMVLIDDKPAFKSGPVPEIEEWDTYDFTFKTKSNQTKLKLTLRNEAPGGIGNDLALDNIGFSPCGPNAVVLPEGKSQICDTDTAKIELTASLTGDQYSTPVYQWQMSGDGNSWTNISGANNVKYTHIGNGSKRYYYRYLVANSIDHLSNSYCYVSSETKVIELVSYETRVIDTICSGEEFSFGTRKLTMGGKYTELFTSSNGCDSTVELYLTVVSDDNPADLLDTTAFDFCVGSFAETNYPTNLKYRWADSDTSARKRFDNNYSSELTVSSRFCKDTVTVTATRHEVPTIDIPELFTFCKDSSDFVEVMLPAMYSYTWDDGLTENVRQFRQDGLFRFTITDNGYCTGFDSVTVQEICPYRVLIPNVFTPLGLTPRFRPYLEFVKEVEFNVYNTWGELIHTDRSTSPSWDGIYKGKLCQDGVYFYSLQFRSTQTGTYRHIKGIIHLLR